MTGVFCCFCKVNLIKTPVTSPEFVKALPHFLLHKTVAVIIKRTNRAPLNDHTSVKASPPVGFYK